MAIKKATELDFSNKKVAILISGRPNIGKEQPLYSKVLTKNGWKTMGEIEVGDKVYGKDGKLHTVIGVFPQGEKDVYEITFNDQTQARCGLEHLWNVIDQKNKLRTLTLKEIKRRI